jgi:Holliday junction resolvasome RuvABC endonuclease subunit
MIVAFDLSLTCTGWADDSYCGVIVPPANQNRGIPRLRWIRDAVLERAAGAALVVLEGYSFASRGRAIISLGELGGVVRCALADAGIAWVDVPPSCRALFATGKGNASKEQVLAEAIRKLGYQGHSNDEADALWLCRMAIEQYKPRPSVTPLSETKRRAMEKIEWPVLNRAQSIGDDLLLAARPRRRITLPPPPAQFIARYNRRRAARGGK